MLEADFMFIRRDQQVCRAFNYGETQKVRINGKKETIEADGKLERFISKQVARRNGFESDRHMFVDLRDQRLGKLLGNPREIDRLMKKAGRFHKRIDSECLFVGTHLRHYYSQQDLSHGPKPNYPEADRLMENLEIKLPFYEGNQLVLMEGQNITISRAADEGEDFCEDYNLVSISAETPRDYQKVSAEFDPQTGKIYEETIREFIIHKPKK